jgi:hypothetical protein
MKKFNGFEAYLILEGLKEVAIQMKASIEDTEKQGKLPLMTTGYVDMIVAETVEKVKSLTLKQKK